MDNKCPNCNIVSRIDKVRMVMKDDKLYREFTLKCRNPNCGNYNKEIGTFLNEIPYDKE